MKIIDMQLLLILLLILLVSVYSKLLKGKNEDMKLLLEKELKSGGFSDFPAECLTDTWIGRDRYHFLPHPPISLVYTHTHVLCGYSTSGIFCIRWAFIDLTAGPFSWGPAVGGEGVRTERSLPNVQKTIGAVAGTVDYYSTRTFLFYFKFYFLFVAFTLLFVFNQLLSHVI